MKKYRYIPINFLRKLGTAQGIQIPYKLETNQIESFLEENNQTAHLVFLNDQFRFTETTSSISLVRPVKDVPQDYSTPELFLNKLVNNNFIEKEQIDTLWFPTATQAVQLCGISHKGSSIYLKMMKGRKTNVTTQTHEELTVLQPHFADAVIHFRNPLTLELRFANKTFKEFILDIIGLSNCETFPLTKVTKEQALEIYRILEAKIGSSHINNITGLRAGSMEIYQQDEDGLSRDELIEAIKRISGSNPTTAPEPEVLDEKCHFRHDDQSTKITIPVNFHINLRTGELKFINTNVTEDIINRIMNAFTNVLPVEVGYHVQYSTDIPTEIIQKTSTQPIQLTLFE